jgi:hypothetical protein
MCCLGASVAQAERLICQIKNERKTGGWIPLVFVIDFDRAAGTAVAAYDLGEGAQTTEGTILLLNDKRITFRFQAEGLRSRSNQYITRMVYRPTYRFDTNKLTVTAKPLGYANQFRGEGGCSLGESS